jgi:hypothetical protein
MGMPTSAYASVSPSFVDVCDRLAAARKPAADELQFFMKSARRTSR